MRPIVTLSETIQSCFDSLMLDVCTSIPASVLSFDTSNQTAEIQIAIQGVDSEDQPIEQFPILSVPVLFFGSSNYSVQHKLEAGDEGIAIFSQRCIDNWLTKGNGYPPTLYRFHDINDAMFITGLRSFPKRISSFNNDGISIAKNDGSQSVTLKANGDIEIKSSGKVIIDGVDFAKHKHESGTLGFEGDQTKITGDTGKVDGEVIL